MYIKKLRKDVHMEITGSADFVEGMYIIIKKAALEKKVDVDGLNSLADLCTELANRLKEEKSCGESKGQEC